MILMYGASNKRFLTGIIMVSPFINYLIIWKLNRLLKPKACLPLEEVKGQTWPFAIF